ncbi:hypothetical protein ACLOJK_012557 [Asimina triloba]
MESQAGKRVLETSPAHAKALYRRGVAYMSVGDFDEARSDFEMMIKADKSSEPDATAALAKLKQKEQEIEKKARKQFKGLFDKKPGEIADTGGDDAKGEEQKQETENHSNEKADPKEEEPEEVPEAPPIGLFSRLWPTEIPKSVAEVLEQIANS